MRRCALRTLLRVAFAGVESVEVALDTKTAVVKGDASTAALLAAMEAAGRPARVLGQGDARAAGFKQTAEALGCSLESLQESLAAVGEFKGQAAGHGGVMGVVRLVQATPALCRVEAFLDGLVPGPHLLALHTLGPLSTASTTLRINLPFSFKTAPRSPTSTVWSN